MAQNARKLNFMIKDDLAIELEKLVPPGKRSKVVNDAIAKELDAIRRQKLTEKLLSLRQRAPSLSTEEILTTIKEDRKRR